MTEPTEESWQELADAAMTRLLAWDLTQRDKLVAGWLVELSYRRGRESVCVPVQGLFAKLTGLDEAHVSRSLAGLQRAGLLQVMGPRNGPKWYRLLPNGRLLEPETLADPNQVRSALAEIERANAPGPGCEPGGQRRMQIVTNEEQLAVEQAAASRVMAREAARFLREPDLAERARSPEVILPKEQDRFGRSDPATDAGAYARARNVTSYHGNNHVRRDVGDVAGDTDSGFALEQIRELLPASDFQPWERKWKERCRAEPLIMLEAIGDTKALDRVQKVRSWGGTIFKRARELAAAAGRNLRMFGF